MSASPTIGQRVLKRVRRFIKILRGRPPALLDAHLAAAYGFRDLGAHDRAARSFEAAILVAPKRYDLWKEHAVSLRHARRFDEAEAALRRYMILRSHDAETYIEFAQVVRALGRPVEAAEALAAAVAIDASVGSSVAGLVTAGQAEDAEVAARLGHEARDERDHAAAASHYGRAMEIDETRTDLIAHLGNALKDDGQLERAITVYRKGIALFPTDAGLSLQLGHALKMSGRRAEAIAEYREASRKDPNLAHDLVELVWLGERAEQQANFDAQLRGGTVEGFLKLVLDVSTIKTRITEIEAALPRSTDLAGIPVERYGVYRALFGKPSMPARTGAATGTWLVIVSAHDLRQDVLFEQLGSFRSQTLATFQVLYLGRDPALRAIIDRASLTDARVKWQEADDSLAAETMAVQVSAAETVLFLAPDSVPHPDALAGYSTGFRDISSEILICDDEVAVRTGGELRFSAPRLHAAVDYDSLLVANNLGSTLAIRRDAYSAAAGELCDGERPARRSSLLLHYARDGRVGHLPIPLIWRRIEIERDDGAEAGHVVAVEHHAARNTLPFTIRPSPENTLSLGSGVWRAASEEDRIAIAIPTRNNGRDVLRMVDSLHRTATRPDRLDVVVIDNGSTDQDTESCLRSLADDGLARIERFDEPFNWSRLNNKAASLSDAPLLVFANDDMEMRSPGWDACLRGLLQRPEIGVVGARLVYGDDTLQHGGVLLGWHGAGIHDGLYQPVTDPGPLGRWHLPRSVAAVTGAFLATRREVFDALGGFDDANLPIAWSDLDYCLSVRARGLRIHWTPNITLFHFESKTRGFDDGHPDRNARPAAERAVMEARWGAALVLDPSVNPHWHMATLPFRLLRAPSENRVQDYLRHACAPNPWILPQGAIGLR